MGWLLWWFTLMSEPHYMKEGNLTIRSEIWTENIHSLGFQDIREGLTLRSLEYRPYAITLLNWTPIFEWQVVRLVVKNRHQTHTCYNEIGQCAQNTDTIPSSIFSTNERTWLFTYRERDTFTSTSYYFGISTPFLILRMTIFVHNSQLLTRWGNSQSDPMAKFSI